MFIASVVCSFAPCRLSSFDDVLVAVFGLDAQRREPNQTTKFGASFLGCAIPKKHLGGQPMIVRYYGLATVALISLFVLSSAPAAPLHNAAREGDIDEIKRLIAEGANIKARDDKRAG